MFIQHVKNVFDIQWQVVGKNVVTYADIYKQFEIEQCHYNFSYASTDRLFELFDQYEAETIAILTNQLVFPAYEYCLKCSHTFNLLDARGLFLFLSVLFYCSYTKVSASMYGLIWKIRVY